MPTNSLPSAASLPPSRSGSAPGFLTGSARFFFQPRKRHAPANSLRLPALASSRDSNAGAPLISLPHPGLGGWPSVVRSMRRKAPLAPPQRGAVRGGFL